MLASALASVVSHVARHTSWFKERLYQQLLHGEDADRLRAVSILADVGAESHLLRGLQSEDEKVSEMARRGLDHLWFHAAGRRAYAMMETAYAQAEEKKYAESIETLDRLLEDYPNYVEALNRRAAALWQVGEYSKSRRDCERALSINPNHYGAWQGLGVSQLQLGALEEACRSLEAALRIAPHDKIAQRCLKKVEDLLRASPRQKIPQLETDLL
jgi:tetratricopeptide (TPR) repeat protein